MNEHSQIGRFLYENGGDHRSQSHTTLISIHQQTDYMHYSDSTLEIDRIDNTLRVIQNKMVIRPNTDVEE